ncbi:MAG: hypothetical protein ABSD42_03050 [Candidatus Bathyarchaeia archaeon]|jgi:hypothetical protein
MNYMLLYVFVEAPLIDDVAQAFSKIDAVEELCEVTGEFDIQPQRKYRDPHQH